MGAQFLSTCFETVAEATTHYYQSQAQAWVVDQTPNTLQYSWNGAAWRLVMSKHSATGVRSVDFDVAAPPVLFPYCAQSETTAQFSDGVLLGWGVVSAMAIAWGLRALRREAER